MYGLHLPKIKCGESCQQFFRAADDLLMAHGLSFRGLLFPDSCFIHPDEFNCKIMFERIISGKKKAVKKYGFGNHSEAKINLNLKLNYENSYFTLSMYSPLRVSTLTLSP